MTKRKAISTIVGHGVNGTVTFTQATDKAPVVVEGTISGLKIGEVFGLHVHEFGNLSEHGMSAGGHFNPKNVAHGSRTDEIRHLGDLGNIYSDAFGVAKIGFVDDRVSLFGPDAILGRSLIVSKNRDDLGRGEGEATLLSKVTGNSGGFHAGGAILASNAPRRGFSAGGGLLTEQYERVFVEENEGQMELTRLHAHFPDGGPGPITYTLQSGDQSTFSVDPISGKVLLLRALDAESEPGQLPPVHRLKVGTAEQHKPDQFVMEPGLAHSCEMTIHVVDINDWIPNFAQEKYEFKIAESATSGTIVGQVVAFDQDLTAPNNKIRYELLEQQQQSAAERRRQRNPFQIDTESGQIVVSDAEQLAHLAGQTVHLVAKAVDGGLEGTEQNGTAQVEIVVTEEMARTTMSAPAVTTTVATTTKKFGDEDDEASPTAAASPLAPSVKSRTTGSASEISAPIWTVHAPPLPPATIAAVQTASPQIQFVAHMFNASVAEGKRPPVLQTLEVHNKPRDTRFTICAIREGNVKGAFSVTPNLRGDCEVRTQMQLDRESVANYRMNVSIQNGVQTDSAIVAVSVLDINDNKPKFVDATTASSSSAASSFDTSFAVLSLETEANAQFFSLTVLIALHGLIS
uniref:Superoxide dismutase n=1 Tax=Globodera pallida TaxID=36090 RepID=A0A183BZB1_GLOPA